jgi:enoyl-CoA hydratase/carnithine racemase
MAERIRDNAPMSVSAGKRSIRSAMALGSERGFVEALEHYRAVYASEDAQEGPRAFAERRAPVWKGC